MIIRPGEMKDKREIFAIAKQQAGRLPKLKADLDKINDVIVTVLDVESAGEYFAVILDAPVIDNLDQL